MAPAGDTAALREAIREEYTTVATEPERGFHFHTSRPLLAIVGYEEAWLEGIPEPAIAAFAGTGNPFSLGLPAPGAPAAGCSWPTSWSAGPSRPRPSRTSTSGRAESPALCWKQSSRWPSSWPASWTSRSPGARRSSTTPPQEGSARHFGTQGINVRARKPEAEAEWWEALSRLGCALPEGAAPA